MCTPLVDKQFPEQAKELGISEADGVQRVMLKDTANGSRNRRHGFAPDGMLRVMALDGAAGIGNDRQQRGRSGKRGTGKLASLAAHRAEIRAVLRQYVDERLRWANGEPDPRDASARELLDRLWKSAASVGEQNPGGVDVFLGFVSRVIELQQERLMVRERSRIPSAYWVILYIVALLAMAAVGCEVR